MYLSHEVEFLGLLSGFELEESISTSAIGLIDAYNRGFSSGLNWRKEWLHHAEPGGPWIYGGKYKQMREQSENENAAWIAGWKHGRKQNPQGV